MRIRGRPRPPHRNLPRIQRGWTNTRQPPQPRKRTRTRSQPPLHDHPPRADRTPPSQSQRLSTPTLTADLCPLARDPDLATLTHPITPRPDAIDVDFDAGFGPTLGTLVCSSLGPLGLDCPARPRSCCNPCPIRDRLPATIPLSYTWGAGSRSRTGTKTPAAAGAGRATVQTNPLHQALHFTLYHYPSG